MRHRGIRKLRTVWLPPLDPQSCLQRGGAEDSGEGQPLLPHPFRGRPHRVGQQGRKIKTITAWHFQTSQLSEVPQRQVFSSVFKLPLPLSQTPPRQESHVERTDRTHFSEGREQGLPDSRLDIEGLANDPGCWGGPHSRIRTYSWT